MDEASAGVLLPVGVGLLDPGKSVFEALVEGLAEVDDQPGPEAGNDREQDVAGAAVQRVLQGLPVGVGARGRRGLQR